MWWPISRGANAICPCKRIFRGRMLFAPANVYFRYAGLRVFGRSRLWAGRAIRSYACRRYARRPVSAAIANGTWLQTFTTCYNPYNLLQPLQLNPTFAIAIGTTQSTPLTPRAPTEISHTNDAPRAAGRIPSIPKQSASRISSGYRCIPVCRQVNG